MIDLPNIRNITVTGRIASGATTLALQLAHVLGWKFIEGGKYNDEFFAKIQKNEVNVSLRPDELDKAFDDRVKNLLLSEERYIIQGHLTGFMAQGIEKTYKILTSCEDKDGNDRPEVRVERLIERKKISLADAQREIRDRDLGNLMKWRKMYAHNDQNWVYWDRKYYDLVVNTCVLDIQESLEFVLKKIGVPSSL